MPVAGNAVHELWLYLDGTGAPKGGMASPADVTLKLFKASGASFAISGETVTWSAVSGQTGYYDIAYTPNGGGFYKLDLEELNADSQFRRWSFTQEVLAAGSVFLPSLADAFCAESDVERWLQQPIDSSTSPSDSDSAAFCVNRAACLMSLCARLNFAVTPTTVTTGSRLQTILRDANAIWAALDYTAAQILGIQPSKTERFEYFRSLLFDYIGGVINGKEVPGLIENDIVPNLAPSLATNHILSGDTQAAPAGSPPVDLGVGPLTMGDTF
jgi:hypothetical protein